LQGVCEGVGIIDFEEYLLFWLMGGMGQIEIMGGLMYKMCGQVIVIECIDHNEFSFSISI
jgi:hypothetical protein